jgi:hypothetical protein
MSDISSLTTGIGKTSLDTTDSSGGQNTTNNRRSKGGRSDGTHSAYLCPLLLAIADTLFGGDRSTEGRYAYAQTAERMRNAGFLWDELVAAYARDFTARHITLAHFDFDAKGHSRGKVQETLLFPPSSVFVDSRLGRSRIPEEAFSHLLVYITQERNGVTLDPSEDGRAAAAAALAAFSPAPVNESEPLPPPRQQSTDDLDRGGRGRHRGGGRNSRGGGRSWNHGRIQGEGGCWTRDAAP